MVVFYHKDCSDGFGAAWAAWKKFGKRAVYRGLDAGGPLTQDPLAAKLENADIYFLDRSPSKEELMYLLQRGNDVIIIDHHASSEKVIKSAPRFVYGVKNSGAVLSWKFFHPKKKVPLLLKIVEDRDLWKWRLRLSREITAALDLEPFDFKRWNAVAKQLENLRHRKKYIEKGKVILQFQDKVIKELLSRAQKATLRGHRALVVNAPHRFASELGNSMIKRGAPLAIIWADRGNAIRVSLRSDGTVDAGKIAVSHGGGGHKASAGFTIKKKLNFPWKVK